jgi:hypothetical protein
MGSIGRSNLAEACPERTPHLASSGGNLVLRLVGRRPLAWAEIGRPFGATKMSRTPMGAASVVRQTYAIISLRRLYLAVGSAEAAPFLS